MKIELRGSNVVLTLSSPEAYEAAQYEELSLPAEFYAVAERAFNAHSAEEARLAAAQSAFEAEKAQARKDYGFTDRELRFSDTAEEALAKADALLNAWAKPDREVEWRKEYQCDPYVPCSCGVPADEPRATWLSAHAVDCAYRVTRTAQAESRVLDRLTAEQSPADAAQERADRMFPDREGRVEGVDR